METLYRIGDRMQSAFLVPGGDLQIVLPDRSTLRLKAEHSLVGALEYFLRQHGIRGNRRLFEVRVSSPESVKQIGFETIDAMILEHEFGLHANRHLARVLEMLTRLFIKLDMKKSLAVQEYESRARMYAGVVIEVERLAKMAGVKAVAEFLTKHKEGDIFSDGKLLCSEQQLVIVGDPSLLRGDDKILSFKKGAPVCMEGDKDNRLFILLSGVLAVERNGKYIARIESAGEGVGELSLLLNQVRTASLIAEQDADLLVLQAEDLEAFHKTHMDFYQNVAFTLAKRIYDTHQRIQGLRSGFRVGEETQRGKRDLRILHRDLDQLRKEQDTPLFDRVWGSCKERYLEGVTLD